MRRVVPVISALSLLVLAVFWQVGDHAFVNFDDQAYVYENSRVLRGLTAENVSWAFTTFHFANWHPVTWLSHMLDVTLFGSSAGWHHRMNLLFHLLNTNLLFLVLWRMTGGIWQSAVVAALFGVHPLHVESVAWISERKGVLSTFFWILAMGAYLRFVRKPSTARYLLMAGVYALGLMSKSMLVTLPFVLLLLDYWPLQRVSRNQESPGSTQLRTGLLLVMEKVPLLALSAASSAITFIAQSRGEAVNSLEQFPFAARLSNAVVSYAAYLAKTIWPASLAVFYPLGANQGSGAPVWKVAGAVLLLGTVSVIVVRRVRSHPYLLTGWLLYLGTLVPVIGIVQVGNAAMADRYTYLPLIGIFLALAWFLFEVIGKQRFGRALPGLVFVVAIAASTITAWAQTGYWRDSVALFSHALTVTDESWQAWNNLGLAKVKLGRIEEGIECYKNVLRMVPCRAGTWSNLGFAYLESGRIEQGVECYLKALRIQPDLPGARLNLGNGYDRLGRYSDAVECFRDVLRTQPDQDKVWLHLGVTYYKMGMPSEAVSACRESIRINPASAMAWYNLGLIYHNMKNVPAAIEAYREAIRLDPGYAKAWNNLGIGYETSGRTGEAIDCFRRALYIKPDHPEAAKNLERLTR